jgi:hypothetical protein
MQTDHAATGQQFTARVEHYSSVVAGGDNCQGIDVFAIPKIWS